MSQTITIDQSVSLTEDAARRIREIVAREPGAQALRVSVEGGGCSGFQYRFNIVGTREADDIVIELAGATLLVDRLSLEYMGGSTVDYVDDLIGAQFKVKNPHAVAACGCGTSFTV